MLNYFNSSEVLRITKMLKDILTEFEAVKTKRAKLCAASYQTHEENVVDSRLDPSSYFLFRFLDKSVTITRDYHYKTVPHYMVTLENWRPNKEDVKNLYFDVQTNSYGSFDSFEDVLHSWVIFCFKLIEECSPVTNVTYQWGSPDVL